LKPAGLADSEARVTIGEVIYLGFILPRQFILTMFYYKSL